MYRLTYLCILFLLGCRENNLVLIKCDPQKWDEIDTVETNDNITILRLIDERSMGDFKMDYAIGKSNGVFYRISNLDGNALRSSKDYIAFSKDFGAFNWGWFYVENGRLQDSLPGLDIALDSLSENYPSDSFFLRTTNGFIDVLRDGKLVTTVKYGVFFPGLAKIKFGELEYKLFKKDEERLIEASDNVDSIFFQPSGLYFVPSPGYGLISKFDKKEIFSAIDSASKIGKAPDMLRFKKVE